MQIRIGIMKMFIVYLMVVVLVPLTSCRHISRSKPDTRLPPYEMRPSDNTKVLEMTILDKLLDPKYYDKRVRPGKQKESATTIKISIYLLDIYQDSPYSKEFKVHCYFRQRWKDDRLFFRGLSRNVSHIRLNNLRKIWMPDLMVLNEVKSQLHDLLLPNHSAHISDDGSVLVTSRFTIQIRCNIDFTYFPHDQQRCKISIESFGFFTDEVILQWDDEKYKSGRHPNLEDSTLTYSLTDIRTVARTLQSGTAKYNILEMEMLFIRNFQLYLWTVYLPYGVLVLVCFSSSVFMAERFATKMVVILVALMLMMILPPDFQILRSNMTILPAIGIWIFGCFSFVIVIFFSIVITHRVLLEVPPTVEETRSFEEDAATECRRNMISGILLKCHPQWKQMNIKVFSILFFVVFVTFNVVYGLVCHSACYSSLEEWDDALSR